MLRTVRAASTDSLPLPLRAGVNRGRVFAGEVGAPFRRTYTILGDTAALAARLMARAKPRPDARRRGRARALAHARSRNEAAGVRGEGQVRGGRAARRGRGRRDAGRAGPRALPLVDRQRELALLAASLAPARTGFGTLVELVGDAGIGKTRLVEEMRADTDAMTVLSGGRRAVRGRRRPTAPSASCCAG